MIESLIPRWDEARTEAEPESTATTESAELAQLRSQVEQLTTQLQQLQKPPEQEEKQEEQQETETPKPPSFPDAPTSGSSQGTDHRAKLIELYNQNPYRAAEYLKSHSTEIANSAKELI